MGGSGSVYDEFDQKAWCEQHRPNVNPADVQATFLYVRWHHPLFGCAKPQSKLPRWQGNEPIETLATMADAVTCLCTEELGQQLAKDDPIPGKLENMNTTAIGNLAYIARFHSNEHVRNTANKQLQNWRKLQKK